MKDETIKKISKEDICMMALQDAMRHARENIYFDIRLASQNLLNNLEKKQGKKNVKVHTKKIRKSKKKQKRKEEN